MRPCGGSAVYPVDTLASRIKCMRHAETDLTDPTDKPHLRGAIVAVSFVHQPTNAIGLHSDPACWLLAATALLQRRAQLAHPEIGFWHSWPLHCANVAVAGS